MRKKFFFFLFLLNNLYACCCCPKISCKSVAITTKTTSLSAKKILAINDSKIFAMNLKKINSVLNEINEIENDLIKYRDYLNALKFSQLLILKQINENLKQINSLKYLLINAYLNVHKTIDIYNKIYLYRLITEEAKTTRKELMEFINERRK